MPATLPSCIPSCKITPEGGDTFASLDNAKRLVSLWGNQPTMLTFYADTSKGDYYLTVWWGLAKTFTFSGFSWGYSGTGPRGLDQFLAMLFVTNLTARDIPVVDGMTRVSYALHPVKSLVGETWLQAERL